MRQACRRARCRREPRHRRLGRQRRRNGYAPTPYTPAQLPGLPASQKTGFVGVLYYVGQSPFLGWDDVGFGLDSSLAAAPGSDNATGYAVPNGLLFIESAQFFARNHCRGCRSDVRCTCGVPLGLRRRRPVIDCPVA